VRRPALLALALAAALVASGTAFFLGRGDGGNDAVAHVGAQTITKEQLETVVDHFRLEAKREGTPFPADDSTAGRSTRNRLLGVLVYRVELKQAARRLGIETAPVQVLRRMHASGSGEAADRDAFEYGSVEAQLLYEAVFRKVAAGVRAPTQAALSARRNEAVARYVARIRRETKVRYEPGYAPGS
jgi:hypothetical protein